MHNDRLTIAQINEQCKRVILEGWVTRSRNMGAIVFMELRDSTGLIQIVASKATTTAGFDLAGELKPLDSIRVVGELKWTEMEPEVAAETIELITRGLGTKSPTGRHMELRQTKFWAVMRIRDCLIQGLVGHLQEDGFINAPPPSIIPPNKNSGFQFDFYGRPATLSQSGALYMSALALSFGQVYSIHPVFRSEKSKTRRHLAEFWMLELEVAQLNLEELLVLIEALIINAVQHVLKHCSRELKILGRDRDFLGNICQGEFPIIDYGKVVKRLKQEGYEMEWGTGLGQYESVVSHWFNKPLFIIKFPRSIGSWTAQPEKLNVSMSVNLLAPEGYGEILEGCQRNIDPDFLDAKFRAAGVELDWYADIHRYGGMIHSGAGLGIERLCQWICGANNIRDVIPFPRSLKDFYP
ncbi:MAG TPA: hypothetical protein DEF34_06690 [Desulfotomaculum sp.]|nr:MAG: hypothetical protein JL56_07865 [Desulfotomaculum sp. BICA1-6]HBX23297.1 hypothetical protein [Desulfotomaculum sp.]